MKKILICLFTVASFMIISCQNTTESVVESAAAESKSGGTSSESGGGNPGSTGTDNGYVPVAIGDDGTVSVGARNLVSLGEGTEVLCRFPMMVV